MNTDVLLAISILVLLIASSVPIAFVVSMRMVQQASLVEVSARDIAANIQSMGFAAEHKWALNHGFRFSGLFLMKTTLRTAIGVWEAIDSPTSFVAYSISRHGSNSITARRSTYFLTQFENNGSLSTGSSHDANLLPHPAHAYAQSFSGITREESFDRHVQSLQFLTIAARERIASESVPFQKRFTADAEAQYNELRSIPWWAIRCWYWLLVRCYKTHNKCIEDLLREGWIRLEAGSTDGMKRQ